MKLGFIGGGNMAAAMIGGLLQKGFTASDIKVAETSPQRCAWLAQEYGVAAQASADDGHDGGSHRAGGQAAATG